ncbi:MAG: membrane protein insertase YidC [Hyphomonas sp.]|nr:membrane protein insertase YidC [Hyphomonas sp.]
MEKDDQRNFILAMVLMIAVVFGYQKFFLEPAQKRYEAEQAAIEASKQAEAPETGPAAASSAAKVLPLSEALAADERVAIDGAAVDGSIRLAGARIDDVSLKDNYRTVEKTEEVRLFRPENSEYGYFATYYWADGQTLVAGRNSPWTLVSGDTLSSGSSVTLRLEGNDVTIERTISLDEHYMFTFTDTVTNNSDAPKSLRAIGAIQRLGEYKAYLEETDPGQTARGIAHEGLMGWTGGELRLRKFGPLMKLKKIKGETADGKFPSDVGGWWGLSDKYFLGALIPQQDLHFDGMVDKRKIAAGANDLDLRTESAALDVAPGASVTMENRIFAGAKRYQVLKDYQAGGIPSFVDAIDWGFFFFLTKPFFFVLEWLSGVLGSFGWAILALTVLVKAPLVPLYNQSYKSMAKMKKLQEPTAEIRERFKADPQRQQQEIMKLYKEEGANPLGGCLPILATIPVFFALYKMLSVTIEMRHTAFLWMKDLSAPDPTAIGNLFGLLPWAASDVKSIPIIGMVIGIGILPLLYGATMSALQTLSPPPPDPMQRRMIQLMPLIFMFLFGTFASGLVMYWVWSNTLSFIQQYAIMRMNGVETEIGKFVKKLVSGGAKASS